MKAIVKIVNDFVKIVKVYFIGCHYLCNTTNCEITLNTKSYMKKSKIIYCALVAALGAVVVGLNLGGISGAIDLIVSEFKLSALAKGFVTGSLLIGCLVGALIGGNMADKYGRKPLLYASAILLGLAAIGCWIFTPSWVLLVLYRFLAGFGVGILSAVIPTYISEISPAELRGTLVSFYQTGVVIGILVSYILNFYIRTDWHLMLGAPVFIALIAALLLSSIPESPCWKEIREHLDDRKEGEARFSDLFKGKVGKVVFIGCMLAFFQQITGINVVVNYAPSILGSLGLGDDPLLQTVYIGIANLIFTFIALWLCDKLPRKTLLIGGGLGSFLSLAYLSYAYSIANPNSIAVLAAIICFIAFFALSFSPLMFVVTSEIYPSKIRGTAMALSTGISWACAFIVVQTYPVLEASIGTNVAFGIFAALMLFACIYIAVRVPETKGKTLEKIQKELKLDE